MFAQSEIINESPKKKLELHNLETNTYKFIANEFSSINHDEKPIQPGGSEISVSIKIRTQKCKNS